MSTKKKRGPAKGRKRDGANDVLNAAGPPIEAVRRVRKSPREKTAVVRAELDVGAVRVRGRASAAPPPVVLPSSLSRIKPSASAAVLASTSGRGKGRKRARTDDPPSPADSGAGGPGGKRARRAAAAAAPSTSSAVAAAVAVQRGRPRGARSSVSTKKEDKKGGLRHFSLKVCQQVEIKGVTNYAEVANELVDDYKRDCRANNVPSSIVDQKNIRRRVYDALNVLRAMNIISKTGKQISWVGLPVDGKRAPSSSSRSAAGAKKKKKPLPPLPPRPVVVAAAEPRPAVADAPGGVSVSQAQLQEVRDRLETKRGFRKELVDQQLWYRDLLSRNLSRPELLSADVRKLALPFILVSTRRTSTINCQLSDDHSDYSFNFSEPFEIHDYPTVLKGMHEDRSHESLSFYGSQQHPSSSPGHHRGGSAAPSSRLARSTGTSGLAMSLLPSSPSAHGPGRASGSGPVSSSAGVRAGRGPASGTGGASARAAMVASARDSFFPPSSPIIHHSHHAPGFFSSPTRSI